MPLTQISPATTTDILFFQKVYHAFPHFDEEKICNKFSELKYSKSEKKKEYVTHPKIEDLLSFDFEVC